MTRVRLGLAAALVALVAGGTVAASAVAAPGGAAHSSSYSLHTIQVHGAAKGGKKFTGSYAIQHFTVRNNKVYAVGTLTGKLKNRHVSRSNVQLPAKLVAPSSTQTSTKSSTRQATTGGQCTILHLVLGPINLSLLGLNVTLGGGTITPGSPATEPITLNLTGDPNGGLLGSLLCGLDNAIGGSGTTAGILSQLSTQLNQLASTLTSLVALLP